MKYILSMTIFILISLITSVEIEAARNFKSNIIKDEFHFKESSKKSIKLAELNQGCSKIDCIPAIDHPTFDNISKISFLSDDDVMMLVNYKGLLKAYPRKIMQSHEIVNDYFNGTPLAMTYCPLCGTSVAFEPIVEGERAEFGVSGVLHNRDLVMYDRKTRSLWGQLTGRAIVGSQTGLRLKSISVALMTWQQLKQDYPQAQVLLPPTKDTEQYKNFHYQKYVESDKLMFPVSLTDARLATKKWVYGIEIDDSYIAFEEQYLKETTPIVESYGKHILQVTYKNGKATAIDKRTNEPFKVIRSYWFAWFAFHPDTQLRK